MGPIFNVSIQHCPSLLSVAVINTLRKAYLGWKGVITSFRLQSVVEGPGDRSSSSEL